MNKSIVFCANAAWNLYNFRLALMQSFLQAGWQVTGVAPADGYEQYLRQRGIGFVPVSVSRSGTNPLADLRTLWQLRKVYHRLRPDAVCQFTIKPNIYGTLSAASLGIPAVNNISGLGTVFISRSPLTKLVLCLYRHSQKRAAYVFFQNSDDRREFIENGLVAARRTGLLPGSGIDLERFGLRPLPAGKDDTFVFLMIGRLLKDKGAGEFIRAAEALHARYGRRVRCLIAGSTDAENRTSLSSDEVQRAAAEGAVEFLGRLEDVRGAIEAAHCVVLPSYREGTPRSLLEAAAMGRPLIATDVPGCREVVSHGQNGYLCAARDTAALTAVMERMLNSAPEDLERMGRESRHMAETRFSVQRVIEIYHHTIKGLLNGNG